MKLREIVKIVNGKLYGNGDIEIIGPMDIDRAQEGHITYLMPPIKKGLVCNASAVIVSKPIDIEIAQIVVKNPKAAFALLLEYFYPKRHPFSGISKRSEIAEDAIIGKGVCIAPFSVISKGVSIGERTVIYPGVFIGEGVRIGQDCVIYSNVCIMEKCHIGHRVIIHAGAVIGADGFGFVFEEGRHRKIPQIGNVEIGDDVEIGANCTIDRATFGSTVIGSGVKIDNLVQIGHNVTIGDNSIIVAQVGIGGSSKIGEGVILAGQAGVSDHTEIDSGTIIGAQSGVTGRLRKNIYIGTPGRPYKTVIRAYETFPELPELKKRLERLEGFVNIGVKQVKDLKGS
jgi:UDP-3-O-[3-hydroxymyristoyl] glucosamine N-acyltransferase